MPLLDHFAYPLYPGRHWSGFHAAWAATIARRLNRSLPDGWYANPEVRWVREGDAIVVEEGRVDSPFEPTGEVAAATAAVVAVEPDRSLDYEPGHDVVEVQVIDETGQRRTLAGVVEVVSPASKNRPSQRASFVAKSEGYVAAGVGTVLVDVVTAKSRSLHRELMQRLGDPDPEADATYASALKLRDGPQPKVDVWYRPLKVGRDLPDMPLHLKGGPTIAVALEATYLETCEDSRITPERVLRMAAERRAAD